jgi:hypothetical protein
MWLHIPESKGCQFQNCDIRRVQGNPVILSSQIFAIRGKTDASDISKAFEVDDVLAVQVDISEDIRVKTPLVSP